MTKHLLWLLLICLTTSATWAQVKLSKKEYDEMQEKIRQGETLRLENAALKKTSDSLATVVKKMASVALPKEEPKDSAKLKAKDEEIAKLKAETDKLKADIEKLKTESANGAKPKDYDQLKANLKTALDSITKVNNQLKASEEHFSNQKELTEQKEAALAKEHAALQNLQKQLDAQKQMLEDATKLRSENEALMKKFFGELDTEVNALIVQKDFQAAKPKLDALNKEIERLKGSNKNYVNSLDIYSKKLQWYQDMNNTLAAAKKALDEEFNRANIAKLNNDLNNIKTAATNPAKPTVEQVKDIDAQLALLGNYCGQHNYVCNKLKDADDFGNDKIGATEEIDAALERVEASYTFLLRKLKERKAKPTDKTITLKRVQCD